MIAICQTHRRQSVEHFQHEVTYAFIGVVRAKTNDVIIYVAVAVYLGVPKCLQNGGMTRRLVSLPSYERRSVGHDHGRYRLDGRTKHRKSGIYVADRVAWQDQAEDLPTTAVQRLKATGPPRKYDPQLFSPELQLFVRKYHVISDLKATQYGLVNQAKLAETA